MLKKNGQNGIFLDKYLVIEKINNCKDFTDGLQGFITEMQSKYYKKVVLDEEGGEEPPELAPIGYIPDILSESKIYQWAGVGIGEEEAIFL